MPIWMVDGRGRARRVPHVWSVELVPYGRDRPRAVYVSTASEGALALPVARNIGPDERGTMYRDGRRVHSFARIGGVVLMDDVPIYEIDGDGLVRPLPRQTNI